MFLLSFFFHPFTIIIQTFFFLPKLLRSHFSLYYIFYISLRLIFLKVVFGYATSLLRSFLLLHKSKLLSLKFILVYSSLFSSSFNLFLILLFYKDLFSFLTCLVITLPSLICTFLLLGMPSFLISDTLALWVARTSYSFRPP